jgi:hypothetical protein
MIQIEKTFFAADFFRLSVLVLTPIPVAYVLEGFLSNIAYILERFLMILAYVLENIRIFAAQIM